MRKLLTLAALVMLVAAPVAMADTAQQDKMKSCNADAGKKQLAGDERKKFMKECLSAKKEAVEEKKLTPQQQKMKDCNADAGKKQLAGDERKKFMKTCLSN